MLENIYFACIDMNMEIIVRWLPDVFSKIHGCTKRKHRLIFGLYFYNKDCIIIRKVHQCYWNTDF